MINKDFILTLDFILTFYSYLRFYSYDDLLQQMKNYLKRSNNIPMQVLNWLTPLQMRQQIIEKNNIQ